MKKSKGFTIIELLVVIAVIAVLAAIVLVSVTQYLARSRNTSIKGNLATVRLNAASYFDKNNTFVGFEGDVLWDSPRAAISDAYDDSDPTIFVSDNAFCAYANLIGGGAGSGDWCVDSTGYAGPLGTGGCDGDADPPVYRCLAP